MCLHFPHPIENKMFAEIKGRIRFRQEIDDRIEKKKTIVQTGPCTYKCEIVLDISKATNFQRDTVQHLKILNDPIYRRLDNQFDQSIY